MSEKEKIKESVEPIEEVEEDIVEDQDGDTEEIDDEETPWEKRKRLYRESQEGK